MKGRGSIECQLNQSVDYVATSKHNKFSQQALHSTNKDINYCQLLDKEDEKEDEDSLSDSQSIQNSDQLLALPALERSLNILIPLPSTKKIVSGFPKLHLEGIGGSNFSYFMNSNADIASKKINYLHPYRKCQPFASLHMRCHSPQERLKKVMYENHNMLEGSIKKYTRRKSCKGGFFGEEPFQIAHRERFFPLTIINMHVRRIILEAQKKIKEKEKGKSEASKLFFPLLKDFSSHPQKLSICSKSTSFNKSIFKSRSQFQSISQISPLIQLQSMPSSPMHFRIEEDVEKEKKRNSQTFSSEVNPLFMKDNKEINCSEGIRTKSHSINTNMSNIIGQQQSPSQSQSFKKKKFQNYFLMRKGSLFLQDTKGPFKVDSHGFPSPESKTNFNEQEMKTMRKALLSVVQQQQMQMSQFVDRIQERKQSIENKDDPQKEFKNSKEEEEEKKQQGILKDLEGEVKINQELGNDSLKQKLEASLKIKQEILRIDRRNSDAPIQLPLSAQMRHLENKIPRNSTLFSIQNIRKNSQENRYRRGSFMQSASYSNQNNSFFKSDQQQKSSFQSFHSSEDKKNSKFFNCNQFSPSSSRPCSSFNRKQCQNSPKLNEKNSLDSTQNQGSPNVRKFSPSIGQEKVKNVRKMFVSATNMITLQNKANANNAFYKNYYNLVGKISLDAQLEYLPQLSSEDPSSPSNQQRDKVISAPKKKKSLLKNVLQDKVKLICSVNKFKLSKAVQRYIGDKSKDNIQNGKVEATIQEKGILKQSESQASLSSQQNTSQMSSQKCIILQKLINPYLLTTTSKVQPSPNVSQLNSNISCLKSEAIIKKRKNIRDSSFGSQEQLKQDYYSLSQQPSYSSHKKSDSILKDFYLNPSLLYKRKKQLNLKHQQINNSSPTLIPNSKEQLFPFFSALDSKKTDCIQQRGYPTPFFRPSRTPSSPYLKSFQQKDKSDGNTILHKKSSESHESLKYRISGKVNPLKIHS